MNIDVQVIYSGEIACEGDYYFPININSHYYVYPRTKSNDTIVSWSKIINGNVNVKCYDPNDVVPYYLRKFLHNDFISFITLNTLMEEHDNIMYENNQRKIIESEISVSIGTK